MENVNLHELPRKELKQLCNEHNIRTAGVKHDDLVRLLRNKLYPPAPDPPRLSRARSQTSTDSQTSSKSRGEFAEKSLTRSTSQGRTQRSLVFVDDPSRDNVPERTKRELSPNPALIRKPILTKSNSTPARRSDFLRKKVNTLSGFDKQSQERQPQQSDGSPTKGRSVIGGRRPSVRGTSMVVNRPSERLSVKVNGAEKPQTNADANSEAASSPRTSEGGASVTAVDSSDIGSHSFRSVSEIASDAGHRVMSEDSDIDDGRSVSSEPASRFISQTSKLAPRTSTGSKLGRTVLSSWDSGHERDSLESPARNNEFHEHNLDFSAAPSGEDTLSYFLEDADSLVGDTDGLDSFLDTPTADPEDMKRVDGRQVDLEQFRTPETSTAHYQKSNIIDRKGSMREEVPIIHNNESPLTDDLPESLPGDRWLVDYEIAPVSERAGVVETNAALTPSESEAMTESLKSSNGSLPVEKPYAVVDGDSDIAPHSSESPGHSLGYESAIALVTISDSGRNAEPVEDISITLDSTPDILDHRVEHIESAGECQINTSVEEPENLPGIELSFLRDGLSPSGKELSSEASDVLSDLVHAKEEDYDSRGLEAECNSRVSDEGVAGVEIAKSNEDQSEMLATSREISEHNQAATPPLILVPEEIDDVDDSSKHERSRVVVTTSFLDSEIASHCDYEDGTSVGDASCATPGNIQDAKLTPSEPVEDRGDVNWSFVSALYDDLEDVNTTDDMDGYGVVEHMLAEAGETGSGFIRDIEPLEHLKVRESEVANHAGPTATDIERHGVVDEGNESANTSLSDVSVAQGRDSILNEIASISVEQAEVEDISQNGSTGIALKSDSFLPVMYTTEVEATGSDHEHEGTRSDLSIPLDLDLSRVSDVLPDSSVVLSVSQHCIEPVICSVDKVEGEESADNLLRSTADGVSGANYSARVEDESRSFSQTQQTFEGFGEENTSAGVNLQTSAEVEETKTWSTGDDQEDLGLSIEAVPSAGETESSIGLIDPESRMPSSQEQGGVCLQGDKQALVPGSAPDDKLEMTAHDNTAAASQPRKLQQVFTVGLKMIFVIGTLTLGILKFRASRIRSGEKS